MISGKVFKLFFTIVVVIGIVLSLCVGFILGYDYVLQQNDRLEKLQKGTLTVSVDTPGSVMIVIPRGSDTKDIAEILDEAGIISNTLLFTLMSKINGFDGQYLAGTHFATDTLSYDEIMYILSQQPKSVQVTFTEGLSYIQMKNTLNQAGVLYDEVALDRIVDRPSMFTQYDFVSDIPSGADRQSALQGYLFPDTYKFDMNTDEEEIVRIFLSNTENKMLPEFFERAEELGMTIDDVITLASIIEKESGKIKDMFLVSSVFHNRIRTGDTSLQFLQSCATVNYLREQQGLPPILVVGAEDLAMDNPYNTYLYRGLPPGPICSPGLDAIKAALYPDTSNYFYFVADGEGNNIFANSLAQHEANIARYILTETDDES